MSSYSSYILKDINKLLKKKLTISRALEIFIETEIIIFRRIVAGRGFFNVTNF